MQASRSLFQTAIKLDHPAANQPNGIRKHYPFLNIWSNTQSPIRPRQASASSASSTRSVKMASATGFFGFTPNDRRGKPYDLAQHKGKVVLAVNTASKCGFTPQLKGLETVYEDLSKKYPGRFVVIGFPCNQFGGQDPGTDDQIQEFCQVNYGVTFPVLGKIEVNGEHAEPVFEYMKEEKKGVMGLKRIKWNFEKFLISHDGKVVARYSSMTKPESIMKEIVKQIESMPAEKSSL